jgi:YbbR domain-containing protein
MISFLHHLSSQMRERNVRPTRVQALRFGISLLLAILLWGWVTQLQDPYTTRTFANVPIVEGDLPEGMQLVSALPDVRVTLKGAESRVRPIQAGDISVHLDTSGITEPGMYTVDLIIAGPDASERSVEPDEVSIQVDERVSEIFPLRVSYPESTDQGRIVTSIDPAVTQVTVSGPKTAVDRVNDVFLPVTIDQQTRSFDRTFTPYAADAAGQRVTEVDVLPDAVSAHVSIQTRGREVSVIPVITGVPAEGFSVQQRRALPDTIVVDGPEDVIEDLLFVNTQPVDVTDATESISTRVGLADLPKDVTVVEPASGNVEVRVAIEDVSSSSQTLTDLPVSTIGLNEELSATVQPETISIQVSAPVDVLQAMTPSDIVAFVDLTGYGPGTYRIAPSVTVPQGVTWLSSEPSTVVITITSGGASPEPAVESSPVP